MPLDLWLGDVDEIAAQLFVIPSTVDYHLAEVFRKLPRQPRPARTTIPDSEWAAAIRRYRS